MNRRQLFAIYLTNLSVLWICSGLLPLLPLYAAQLGATPAVTGNYLALAFFGTALGTISAGWLSGRLHRRRILIIASGLLSIPATWMMGQATTVWQLTLWTAVVWLLAGGTLALVNVLAGLSAPRQERGKIFGLLALTSSLGGLLGGAMTGPIVDRWDYEMLLSVLAFFWLIQVAGGFLLAERRAPSAGMSTEIEARTDQAGRGKRAVAGLAPLSLLLAASFLLSTARFLGGMGQTMAMDALAFPAAAVTLVAALGSAAGVLLNPLAGRLSDRIGRPIVLAVAYVAGALALITMATATSLLQFSFAAALLTTAYAADAAMPALITDLVPQERLDRWISLLTTTRWIGAIVGYAGTGYAVQFFGLSTTLLAGSFLAFLSLLLLAARPIRVERQSAVRWTIQKAVGFLRLGSRRCPQCA